jgi:hypothetical protein
MARFRFRYPDEQGVWRWRKENTFIPLPVCLQERLHDGALMAPTLREEQRANGERFAVLDFIIEVEKEVYGTNQRLSLSKAIVCRIVRETHA